MFTGIIQQLGSISGLDRKDGDLVLSIHSSELKQNGLVPGDSIAVNGVCLTLIDQEGDLQFDVSRETLSRSLFDHYEIGQRVNLEPALTPSTPLGGHLVSGHVDGVATIESMAPSARSTEFVFLAPVQFASFVAEKGSVCIDGISLTVNSVEDIAENVRFEVNIVPHTLIHTNLGQRSSGDRVHLEIDQVARYLERIISVQNLQSTQQAAS